MTIIRVYEALAELLEYPSLKLDLESCSELICNEPSSVANSFAEFRAAVAGLSLSELQELYTRTFDLSPVCALDIGYHLFGENYKRGIFLANLRETEAPFDLDQEHQLPDFLPVLLRLLTKLDDKELRASLIGECLIPALEKMLKTLSEGDNPYRNLIGTVNAVLKSEVGDYPTTVQRAYLPVLANDPRSGTNAHESEAMQFRVPSGEFVDHFVAVKTNPDLF